MDLAKVPLRISYVGGGTDFPEFYEHNEGAGVIAAAIDQSVFLYAHALSEIAKENIRFTYRETESVLTIDELKHPVMREMLREVNWKSRTNFGTFADLPSGVGLGGSSSFAVALATIIFHNSNLPLDPHALARIAIRIERSVLREAGGIQDQYVAAFGNFRQYTFSSELVSVSEPLLSDSDLQYLEDRQMLIWLGTSRNSSAFAEITKTKIKANHSHLKETAALFQSTSAAILSSSSPIEVFSALKYGVQSGWNLKKEFTGKLDPRVLVIEKTIRNFETLTMKLCGAGGTGFILVLGESEELHLLSSLLTTFKTLKPGFSANGAQLLTLEL